MTTPPYRPLTDTEIDTLKAQGCSCADYSAIRVAPDFRAARVRNCHFAGTVRIGSNTGTFTGPAGTRKIAGLFNATLHDVTIGHNVRIANVAVHVANVDIADEVCIENVGLLETRPGAMFGNGVEIEVLNEGGGRELVLFDRLDAQFAFLLCTQRHRPAFIDKLQAFARQQAQAARADRGTIGRGTVITNVRKIIDVRIGDHAVIDSACSLVNGTVLSTAEAPTTVGCDVQAEDFIIAEAAQVTGGAMLSRSFVGQGCRVGRQFSAENSAFFANCEAFHGEACSVFAGPYTVTHHKSTLLIAGLFSFYNAGSGTNQSNHLYKLGPLHEGKLERGCKTGSFSYLMWPVRVGPFSVVLGKHTRTFDTADFPFSYVEASPTGHCLLTPGFNLTTVGTVRDGAKWPARDRRPESARRDRITFDVFSPLTVGRMLRGTERMKQLQQTTDRAVESVSLSGAEVKRVMLRKACKTYDLAVEMYLCGQIVERVRAGLAAGRDPAQSLAGPAGACDSPTWVDIGGQMMPLARLDDLCRKVEDGTIADLEAFNAALDQALAAYADDQWAWVRRAFEQVEGRSVDDLEPADLAGLADRYRTARKRFLQMVLNDAAKEFDAVVQTGFGMAGLPEQAQADFAAVRGTYETNKFVEQLKGEIEQLDRDIEQFKAALTS